MMKKVLFITIFIIIIALAIFVPKIGKEKKQNELVFWTLQLGTFSEYIQPIIDEFEAKHPEIKVLWVDIPYSEGGKRTLAAILGDNPPDLINSTPDFTTLLAQKNTLYTFESKDVEQYLPSVMNSLTLDEGKTYYAIPFYATTALTFYNKKLLKESKIEKLPKNYSQLYALSETAIKNSKAYITMPTINENDTFLKILNKYDLADENNINSDKAIDLLNQYKDLYNNGFIPKESLTQTHREALEKYMSGQIIFYNGGANFLNLVKENAPDIYAQTDITTQLTGDNGKYDFSLMNLIIPKSAKNKELALEFAQLLTNEQNQLQFAKLTTVMPVNKKTLENNYFKNADDSDLNAKARIISANQLKNVLTPIQYRNSKDLITLLNKTVAEVMLNKVETKPALNNLQKWWKENK